MLDRQATRLREEMHDIWGSGAYAWMYMEA
jgi:hypothetical protein